MKTKRIVPSSASRQINEDQAYGDVILTGTLPYRFRSELRFSDPFFNLLTNKS